MADKSGLSCTNDGGFHRNTKKLSLLFVSSTGFASEFDSLRGGRALVTSEGHVTVRNLAELCEVRCSTDRRKYFPFDRWRCMIDVRISGSVFVALIDLSDAAFATPMSNENRKEMTSSWRIDRLVLDVYFPIKQMALLKCKLLSIGPLTHDVS